MKTLFKTLVLIAMTSFLVSCKSTLQTQNSFDDDVYGKKGGAVQATSDQPSRSNRPTEPAKTYTETNNGSNQDQVNNYTSPDNRSSVSNYDSNGNNNYQNGQGYDQNNQSYDQNNSNSQSNTDGNGNTYVTNNYYDDYYDYEYASRLRRFNDYNMGYGYYDDYYTNSYWYNYDPGFWGVSIYTGYNWWWPSYYSRPWYGYGCGCGYGGGYWGGGYGYGYGGYGYGNGYWQDIMTDTITVTGMDITMAIMVIILITTSTVMTKTLIMVTEITALVVHQILMQVTQNLILQANIFRLT